MPLATIRSVDFNPPKKNKKKALKTSSFSTPKPASGERVKVGRSCIAACPVIIRHLYREDEGSDYIFDCMSGSEIYDVIYLDFGELFDNVPQQRIPTKVKAHGIEGKVWRWTQEPESSGKCEQIRLPELVVALRRD